jgi:hypothetical protein
MAPPEYRAPWFLAALILIATGVLELDNLAELVARVAPLASA